MENPLPIGRIAASAAIIENKRILLLKRSPHAKLFAGHWTFPSGGIEESDESVKAAVAREVKEETGLTFTPTQRFNFYESHAGGKRHFALVHLGTRTGDISLDHSEVSEYQWMSYKEAIKLPLAFAYSDVIGDLHRSGYIE